MASSGVNGPVQTDLSERRGGGLGERRGVGLGEGRGVGLGEGIVEELGIV